MPALPEAPPSAFVARLENRWLKGHFVCVGLDSDFSQLPQAIKDNIPELHLTDHSIDRTREEAIFRFNQQIIDATADLVCAYKPNAAFYEAQGEQGYRALARTVNYLKEHYPDIPVILDAKRADIENTNRGYVEAAFDRLGVDALTVHPYIGREAMQPFLARKDKGILVLVKNSNPGSGEFQDILVGEAQEPLYQVVARHVATSWNSNGNCAVVVGATYPKELAPVRAIVGDMPILVPGIGAQKGEIEATVKAGKDSRNMGLIINASRSIIFASKGEDFAQAARRVTQNLTDEINKYR